jgi:hypothetical protein
LKKKVNIASVKENPKINYVEDNLENRFFYSLKKLISILLVKENPDNPRFIKDSKFKKLVKSIKAFPEMLEKRPIVVDENMIVLGGNMRLKACKSAGLFEVWIDIAQGWTEEQKQEFIVKDNVGFGEWDWDILANEWDVQKLVEWGVDLPVYDVPIDDDQDDKTDTDKEVCELCGK